MNRNILLAIIFYIFVNQILCVYTEPNHYPDNLIMDIPKTGHIGLLSNNEIEVLQGLKNYIKKKGQEDPRFDDWYLLRFCREKEFILKDVIKKWDIHMNFRKKFKIDTLIRDKDFSDINNYSGYQKGYYVAVDD